MKKSDNALWIQSIQRLAKELTGRKLLIPSGDCDRHHVVAAFEKQLCETMRNSYNSGRRDGVGT